MCPNTAFFFLKLKTWQLKFKKRKAYYYWMVFLKGGGLTAASAKSPIIGSHMHPHLTIYDFGSKVQKLYGADEAWIKPVVKSNAPEYAQLDLFLQINSALQVYNRWMLAKARPTFTASTKNQTRGDGTAGVPTPPPTQPRTEQTRSQTSPTITHRQASSASSCSGPARRGRGDDDEEEVEESWHELQERILFWLGTVDQQGYQEAALAEEASIPRNHSIVAAASPLVPS